MTPFATLAIGGLSKDQLLAEAKPYIANDVYGASRDLVTEVEVSGDCVDVFFVTLDIADLGFTDAKRPHTNEFMTEAFCKRWSGQRLKNQSIHLCRSEDALWLAKGWQADWGDLHAILAMDLVTIAWISNQAIWQVSCAPEHCEARGFITFDRARRVWHPEQKILFRLRQNLGA